MSYSNLSKKQNGTLGTRIKKYWKWINKLPKQIWDLVSADGNDEETKNSSDSYISSSEETPDNTPKQVWSIISKKKRPKNESSITLYQETNRNSTKPISNQWYHPKQGNNINHYISQPPIETVQSSYSNIIYMKNKKVSYSVIVL